MLFRSGMNPLTYIKNASKALILAFTSRSSLGTLPVTLEVLTENMDVDSGTASFVTSLGSNMGMNGCAGIYPALVSVMLANMAGVEMNFTFYVMLIIVITISSLGIASPKNDANITTATVFPSAITFTGLEGSNPLIVSGKEVISLSSSLVLTA